MPEGLEHLFSGLVQGIGETKLSLEKEKRDRKERDEGRDLQVLTTLLATPGLKPEQKSEIFRMALNLASGGDKKITNGVQTILGPLLAQQQGDGQTGGVRPSQGGEQAPAPPSAPATPQPQPASTSSPLPSSGLQKLGSSGSGGSGAPSLFYTPEEETQQVAQRAGAVAKATGDVDVEVHQKKLAAEFEINKTAGFKLTGFTEVDPKTGLVTPVYLNDLTQQVKYGTPVDPFTSLEAGRAIEVNKAQVALAREEGVGAILRGKGIDPASATPEQRKQAEQAYASVVLEDQQSIIAARKAGAFQSIATGTAALDRGIEQQQLDINKQLLDYNRQRDDYDKIGQQIQTLVKQVEDSKAAASEYYNQAMAIKTYLEQQEVEEGEEPDANAAAQGYTWNTYHQLLAKAEAELGKARNIAASGAQHFKGSVEAGNLDAKPGVWPYMKDIREPFTYKSLPDMPTREPSVGVDVGGKNKPARKSAEIDVPDTLLKELGLRP